MDQRSITALATVLAEDIRELRAQIQKYLRQ